MHLTATAAFMALIGTSAVVANFDPTDDPGRTSANIHLSGRLTPTPSHPLAGFWKTRCEQDFGLAISPAGPKTYSVSFCGPGGCFKPGTYRPDTELNGDENYRVESDSVLHVKSREGSFSKYVRCWPIAR